MKANHPRHDGSTRRSGFTLLELMIVLVILVLLFALVGPRLLGSQKKADIKTAQTQIGNLEQALEFYAVDNRTYPMTEEGLSGLVEKPQDEAAAASWDGPYLDDPELPKDPWGGEFNYEYPPSNGARDFPNISSNGPDRQPNTEDDIVNWKGDKDDAGADAGSSASDLE